jgi:hypothetical protein
MKPRQDGWEPSTPYSMTHASGWTLAKYIVYGVPRYLLWHGESHTGPFDSADQAITWHAGNFNGASKAPNQA